MMLDHTRARYLVSRKSRSGSLQMQMSLSDKCSHDTKTSCWYANDEEQAGRKSKRLHLPNMLIFFIPTACSRRSDNGVWREVRAQPLPVFPVPIFSRRPHNLNAQNRLFFKVLMHHFASQKCGRCFRTM